MPSKRAAGCLALPGHPQPGIRSPAMGVPACKKSLKCSWGALTLCYCSIASSCITSFHKNEKQFSEPRSWAIGISFGGGRAHQNCPLDFIFLHKKWHSHWLFMPPWLCDGTRRQQHPHSDDSGDAPASLPVGWQHLENGHNLPKTHERISWLLWVFVALESQHSLSFLHNF